ncbi:MAG: sigma-70 family RNA polymerase sigma factor [Caldilineales bacterium]|nr:sigma-70 family RNA polymerase sigma factor [Caldilineales bacterium]
MSSSPPTPAERDLIQAAQRGDKLAFAQLYDLHVDAIYRYVLLRVPTLEQAEDVTEDVFLKAWLALTDYRPQRPFRHWLFRIAHNRAMDEFRQKSVHDDSLEAMQEGGMQVAASAAPMVAHTIRQEEIAALRQALTTMSPDEQTLLTLRFTEGLSFQEIAPILDKSEGACRVLQHRALKKLAQILSPIREAAA